MLQDSIIFQYTDAVFGLNHLIVFLSGHQLCAAPASPSGCHPHGPARGPSPTAAAAAAGVPALSTWSAAVWRHWDWSGWWRGRPFGVRPAATAGASDTEAEAADPAADTHRRVPATARAAVSAT